MLKKIILALLILVLVTSCILILISKNTNVNEPEIPVNPGTDEPEVSLKDYDVTLYFTDQDASKLVKSKATISVKDEEDKYQAALEKLIEGPASADFYPAISAHTKVNSVTVENGLCTVDFTDSLILNNAGGTLRETMCLYSVVNTLCEFDEIKKVIFAVNGKTIETFGQLDMTEPYVKNMSFVR